MNHLKVVVNRSCYPIYSRPGSVGIGDLNQRTKPFHFFPSKQKQNKTKQKNQKPKQKHKKKNKTKQNKKNKQTNQNKQQKQTNKNVKKAYSGILGFLLNS